MVKPWNELSVLIAGCGSIGKRHARVLHGLGVRDLRACDPVAEQRQALAAQVPDVRLHTTYGDGLRDQPDTVVVAPRRRCTSPWRRRPFGQAVTS